MGATQRRAATRLAAGGRDAGMCVTPSIPTMGFDDRAPGTRSGSGALEGCPVAARGEVEPDPDGPCSPDVVHATTSRSGHARLSLRTMLPFSREPGPVAKSGARPPARTPSSGTAKTQREAKPPLSEIGGVERAVEPKIHFEVSP